jgi:hypothetical protein
MSIVNIFIPCVALLMFSSVVFGSAKTFHNPVVSVKYSMDKQQPSVTAPFLVRSSLSMSGQARSLTSQGKSYYISQSIGQASITGTHVNHGHTLRQGFQQPMNNQVTASRAGKSTLQTDVYPNPFHQSVTIVFNENLTGKIHIVISDLLGRTVFQGTYEPSGQIEISPGQLGQGAYLIKISSGSKHHITKLIKH